MFSSNRLKHFELLVYVLSKEQRLNVNGEFLRKMFPYSCIYACMLYTNVKVSWFSSVIFFHVC